MQVVKQKDTENVIEFQKNILIWRIRFDFHATQTLYFDEYFMLIPAFLSIFSLQTCWSLTTL